MDAFRAPCFPALTMHTRFPLLRSRIGFLSVTATMLFLIPCSLFAADVADVLKTPDQTFVTRGEFIRFFGELAQKCAGRDVQIDGYFVDTPMERPWRRIRWLQRQLGWTTDHLVNYCLNHSRYAYTGGIDHIRWLTVTKARGLITGLENSLRIRNEKQARRTHE